MNRLPKKAVIMTDSDLIRDKVKQAIRLLQEHSADCWLTFVRETSLTRDPVLPFLCPTHLTWPSALIITQTGGTIAIVGDLERKALEELGVYDSVVGYVQGIRRPLRAALMAIQPRTIAINYSQKSEISDGLSHGMYLTLVEYLTEIRMENRLISAEPIVSALRSRKSPAELECIRQAVKEAENIFQSVHGFIRPGLAERSIAEFMLERARKLDLPTAWDESHCPAVFTGPETAEAHYHPTDRKVEVGHVLNIDFGVKVGGYCSDLQRTFYVGAADESEVPEEVIKGFTTIIKAIEAARQAMRPGVQGVDVDRVARDLITSSGYVEFPHALGHQVGRAAHDGTALLGPAWEKYRSRPFDPIEESMVFTLEPRLKIPGRGTVTIEEMVVVTATGADYLSTPQRRLLLVHKGQAD